jgi:hypothetical protein
VGRSHPAHPHPDPRHWPVLEALSVPVVGIIIAIVIIAILVKACT